MMRQLRLFIVLFFFLLSSLITDAQTGDYFMSHYSHLSEKIDHTNFDILQDKTGVVNMANRAGILRFDGHIWEHISTNAAIFSLALDESTNTIYGAGIDGFGILKLNDDNQYEYQQLSDTTTVGPITKHYVVGDVLIGLGYDVIYRHNLKTGKSKILRSKYSGNFFKLFKVGDTIYITTENSGLQRVAEDQPENIEYADLGKLNVEFMSVSTSGQWLIGSADNLLYTGSPGNLIQLSIDDQDDYLNASELVDGLWVSDSVIAVATLKGGVIFINTTAKKISDIIDYESGLPDNEVYAFEKDSHGGLWVAHSAGFSRISPNLPFRSFHKYPGLEGNLLSVINHNDSLYVGTTLGLYILEQRKQFETIVYYEEDSYTQEISVTPDEAALNKEEDDGKKKKGGLFGIFRKKKRKQADERDEKENTQTRTVTKSVLRKKTKEVLKSTSYQYKKIKGLDSKVFHLASSKKGLFAAGLDGLFRIEGSKSYPITQEPINHFCIAEESNMLVASTYQEFIRTFSLDYPNKQLELFYDFRDDIQHLFEGEAGKIWMTSNDEISYVKIENGELTETYNAPIENPYYFQTLGYYHEGGTYFVNESGIYTWSSTDELSKERASKPSRYLQGANGEIWVLTEEKWNHLGYERNSDKLNLLSVFKNIKYIASDSERGHWVITQNNELYKITDSYGKLVSPYEMYLKQVKTNDKTLMPSSAMKFEQGNSSFLFEFAQPEFSGIMDVKYQYRLEGLNDEWSEWSGDYNIINFSYLPEGKYTLHVRSKSVLGEVKIADPIEFEIIPPYWKRPWFYAFEITAMATLLFISVRLKTLGFRYRFASRLIALVTLIIIIEFIQTLAESKFATDTSPVLDFLLQITIAFLVLPIESLIRKYVFKEKNVRLLDLVKLKDRSDS